MAFKKYCPGSNYIICDMTECHRCSPSTRFRVIPHQLSNMTLLTLHPFFHIFLGNVIVKSCIYIFFSSN
jgi:hypothetical protein